MVVTMWKYFTMKTQALLLQKRGFILSAFLGVLFLIAAQDFVHQFYLWINWSSALDEIILTPDKLESLRWLLFDVVVFILTGGLWYLKRWAAWGFSTVIILIHIIFFVQNQFSIIGVGVSCFSLIMSLMIFWWMIFRTKWEIMESTT